jgi:hypothetical protein
LADADHEQISAAAVPVARRENEAWIIPQMRRKSNGLTNEEGMLLDDFAP